MSTLSDDVTISIQDAFYNVQALEELQLADNQPCIEANSLPLQCQVSFDTQFEDRQAFITGCSKYIEEATRQAEFNDMLHQGFQHAAHLYTWRCCSRAVPMARSNDQPNRAEINEKIMQVLEPEVRKLQALMEFTITSIDRFLAEFQPLCHPEKRKDFVSESLLLVLGRILNMFVVLDALKDMKASIKNDLSTFHRASQFPQHNLILFLATQNKIKQTLRSKLQEIEGYEELLADLININVHFFEQKLYISPEEKHTYVKVIAFCLYLMDMDTYLKLDQKKRITIQKLDKIFKSIEVVPLFGDMNILPFNFVKQCRQPGVCGPNSQCKCYDPSKWPLSSTESDKCHVDIIQQLIHVRENHDQFVTHLSRIRNEISVYNRNGPLSDAENREMATLTLDGLKLLCAWTSNVVETVSWKLLNPTNQRKNPDCPEDAETYELATKYNYGLEEKAAIIEMISMIKGVQALLAKMETEFTAAIRQHIYFELQDFVGGTLRELLAKAVKHKKDVLTGIVSAIIETCSDESGENQLLNKLSSRSSELSSSTSLGQKIKKTKKGTASDKNASLSDLRTRRRSVVPSNTQLYLARTMLESLIHEKSAHTGRRIYRKDVDEKFRGKMVNFLQQSYFWPALLDLQNSLDQCAELSQLWFCEFFLEMAMGTRIQFPIDMSLPWILINHILSSQDPALLECLFYQLDLYNDAASFALKRFRKQFLYDEVEAEVNLCFDQFVYKLSEAIFTHYKQLAATMLLDKEFKAECARLGITIRMPPAARFETLLKQRHLQLLGRSIDVNRLISQRINAAMLRSMDAAISRFEAEGFYFIMILDNLIEVNHLCHRLLSDHLGSLTDFYDLLAEANRNVSVPNGRITLHAFVEITDDLLPNFCFNTNTRRFVRAKINYRKPPERGRLPVIAAQYEFGSKSLNAAFSNLSMMFSGFVGIPHFQTLAKLIDYQGIAAILGDLLGLARRLINEPIKAHIRVLLNLLPKTCKLQRFDYGLEGNLQYFLHQLRDLSSYASLKNEFCQCLREFGNILALVLGFELGLAHEEIIDLLSAAAFTAQIPKPYTQTIEEQELKMQRLEAKYSRLQIASIVQQLGTETQAKIASESELLTRERLCCGLNIFEMILSRLRDTFLSDPIWRGPAPSNGVLWVDECLEFHRIWSGFLFVLAINQSSNQLNENNNQVGSIENIYGGTLKKDKSIANSSGNQLLGGATSVLENQTHGLSVEELFGDGIYWAGCTIMRLLGQHRRFEVLDFCNHLLRVNRALGGQKQKDGAGKEQQQHVPTTQLIDRIRRIQALNNHVFVLLNNYTMQIDSGDKPSTVIRHFAPPVYQSQQHQPIVTNTPTYYNGSEKSFEGGGSAL